MWVVESESDFFTYIPDDTVLDDIGRCSIPNKTRSNPVFEIKCLECSFEHYTRSVQYPHPSLQCSGKKPIPY